MKSFLIRFWKGFGGQVGAKLGPSWFKNGGTFDFLTLDVGKHYVDYCASFFEQHIVFATALRCSVFELGFDLEEKGNQSKWDALFNENKEETSGVIIKSVLCLTALMINFSVFFKF